METRNFSAPLKAIASGDQTRYIIRLAPYYNGSDASQRRPIDGVVERFAPGCFGNVDLADDDYRISADEDGLLMEIAGTSPRLAELVGTIVNSSIGYRTDSVQWEAGDEVDVRTITKATLIEVGPADDESPIQGLSIWRKAKAHGCEAVGVEHSGNSLSLDYRYSEESDDAIRRRYERSEDA